MTDGKDGLDAATVKLNSQAKWYESHEKSLSEAVKAVTASKAAKTLETAKNALAKKVDEASKLLKDSDGKVQDNATRETLTKAIDSGNKLKDGKEPSKLDEARKALELAIKGVNDSIAAKTKADEEAARSRGSGGSGGRGAVESVFEHHLPPLHLIRWLLPADQYRKGERGTGTEDHRPCTSSNSEWR